MFSLTLTVIPIYNSIGGDSMIKSRQITTDSRKSCATCCHLGYLRHDQQYLCGIDGQKMPDADVMTITICEKYKEYRR